MAADTTYGRGQLEWALWRCFKGHAAGAAETVPKVFLTRIKRLLEIDRDLDTSTAEMPSEAPYAFAPPPSEQSGDTAYRAVDGFCLAVALDLVDAGYKQAEVVFLMRYLRAELESLFPDLVAYPSLLSRRRTSHKARPELPSYTEKSKLYADARVFVALQKIEMNEIAPDSHRGEGAQPLFIAPIYRAGIEALKEALHDLMPNRRSAVTILELTARAQAVATFLEEAPIKQRGRPKGTAKN